MSEHDDITQRLRDQADIDAAEHVTPEVVELTLEAADEIERLRALLSKLRAPVATVNIHRIKLKSRREMDRTIPSERMGWWRDVSPGRHMVLRDATAADLNRCILREGDTRGPKHFLCELEPDGALVSREAIEHCRTIVMPVAALASAPVADERTPSVIWKHTHRATGQVTLSTEDMPDLPFNRKTWESTPHYATQASAPVADERAAQGYGSPADVAQRIEQYLAQDGRMNSGTQLLYEAMKALRASQGDRNDE